MSEIKTVQVINRTKRVYNGVRPNEVRTINEVNLPAYKNFGFEILGKIIEKQEEKIPDNSLTVSQIKEKLSELGIEFDKKWKKDDLQTLLDNTLEGKKEAWDIKWEEDLKKLHDEAAIEYKDGDDLQKLVEENHLV